MRHRPGTNRRHQRSKVEQQILNFEGLLLHARTLQAIDIARAHGAKITDFAPWNTKTPASREALLVGLEYLEEWEADDPQLSAYGRRQSPDTTMPTRLGSILTGASFKHAERIQRLTDKLDALKTSPEAHGGRVDSVPESDAHTS